MSTRDDDEHAEHDDHEDEHEAPDRRRRSSKSGFEGMLRDSFRKAVERGLEAGMGTLRSADTVVRGVVGESNTVGKEISGYVFSQIDETKNVLIRAVAKEVRDFLDTTDLSSELQRALTALSFEIRMEVRFVPNKAGELEPRVRARGVPRASRRERDRERRERDDESPESEADREAERRRAEESDEQRRRTDREAERVRAEREEERQRADRIEEHRRALERDREAARQRAREQQEREESSKAEAEREVVKRTAIAPPPAPSTAVDADETPDDEDE